MISLFLSSLKSHFHLFQFSKQLLDLMHVKLKIDPPLLLFGIPLFDD